MSGGDNRAVVLIIKGGRAKVNQPDIRVLHYPHVLLLQKRAHTHKIKKKCQTDSILIRRKGVSEGVSGVVMTYFPPTQVKSVAS